jgi:hypothetical protein
MNTTTAPAKALAARKLMQAGLLTLLCATGLLLCQQARAVEADFEAAAQDVAVVATAPAAPRTGRLLLAVTRLGERVMRLAPWHRQAVVLPPAPAPLMAAAEDGATASADAAVAGREAWNLKASPDPLVALIQMSRPTLRLAGGPEISVRVLGGLSVTLKSQF